MRIVINRFGGVAPKISPRLLKPPHAIQAINTKLKSGQLAAWRQTTSVATPSKVGNKTSIYLYEGQYWFHWVDKDVDVVPGPIADDTSARVYWTGDGYPKVADNSIAIQGGGTDYPTNHYRLGIPKPDTAPTVTLDVESGDITGATQANPVVVTAVDHGLETGDKVTILNVAGMTQINSSTPFTITVVNDDSFSLNGIDGTSYTAYTSGGTWTRWYDPEDREARAYVYTYVSGWAEEGPPSTASTVVQVGTAEGQTVTLSDMAGPPSGAYNITAKRIYRAVSGSTGDPPWMFVAEVAAATTTFQDTVDAIALEGELESATWIAPPENLIGLTAMANGIFAGFYGKDLCFSEAYVPYAWPIGYRLQTDYPIVAIGAMGSSLVVATEGYPYLATGTDPASMSLIRLDEDQACVSKRSLVEMGGFVVYASPDGLVMVTGNNARVVTKDIIDRDTWQALTPSSIHAYHYEGAYFGFYTGSGGGGFVFDPHEPGAEFSWLTLEPLAGYTDLLTDTLYLQIDANIHSFDTGAAKMVYTWLSPPQWLPKPVSFACLQVDAQSYPVTINLFVGGGLLSTHEVTSGEAVRLAGGSMYKSWQVQATGTATVDAAYLAEAMAELAEV